jgi:replicative DNA helicase
VLGDTESLVYAVESNLPAELFEGESRAIWVWCLEFLLDHGASPGDQAISQKFPSFKAVSSPEPLSFYMEQLRKKHIYNLIKAASIDSVAFLNKGGDPIEALDIYKEMLYASEDVAQHNPDYDWVSNASSRVDSYQNIKRCGGVDGIETPFDTLNNATMGFHGGELIMVVARHSVGKTWAICILSRHMWKNGDIPLIFSKEMVAVQMARRLDALHCKVDYDGLRTGRLEPLAELEWQSNMAELSMEKRSIPIVDEPSGGISHLVAKIRRYRPACALVDGAYLMEDELGSESNWLRINNLCKGMKGVAKAEKIPIIISLQLTEEMKTAGYHNLEENADVSIGLEQTEDQRLTNRMTWKLRKHREGRKCEFETSWDHEKASFEELGSVTIPKVDEANDNVSF